MPILDPLKIASYYTCKLMLWFLQNAVTASCKKPEEIGKDKEGIFFS